MSKPPKAKGRRSAREELCVCGHPADYFHEYGRGRCGSDECVGVCESFSPLIRPTIHKTVEEFIDALKKTPLKNKDNV